MFLDVIGLFISILAICSMIALIGLKKRLDEQTVVLKKILNAIKPIDEVNLMAKHRIIKKGDKYVFEGALYSSLGEAVAKSEQKLMVKYGIVEQGGIFFFIGKSYVTLSDAIAIAESGSH